MSERDDAIITAFDRDWRRQVSRRPTHLRSAGSPVYVDDSLLTPLQQHIRQTDIDARETLKLIVQNSYTPLLIGLL